MKTLLLIACLNTLQLAAQPYVDPFQVRYIRGLSNGNAAGLPFSQWYANAEIPVKLKHGAYIVPSLFFEKWSFDTTRNGLPGVHGLGLAINAIIPLDTNRWTLSLNVIQRVNGERMDLNTGYQLGGAFLLTYRQHQNLKYKIGLYVNREFFGLFFVPLGGIDWRINSRSNLFGVLPNRLTYEYRLHPQWYVGATFRSVTNSYILRNGNYLRLQDNQISTFLDFYPAQHLVINGEAGYGLSRKLRSGYGYNKNYISNYHLGDGFFLKVSALYRIRL